MPSPADRSSGCETVLNQNRNNCGWTTGWSQHNEYSDTRLTCPRDGLQFLEHVVVLPGTLFALELLLQEPRIDVGMITELVLNDVGTAIHVLSRVGREYSWTSGVPDRMAECLVALDLSDLLHSLHGRTILHRSQHAAVAAVWEHCVAVASYASMIAEATGDVSAEDAYLAGLLDDRGAIAVVLGWPRYNGKRLRAGEILAAESMLPGAVLPAFDQVCESRRPKRWKYILDTAHQLAGPQPASMPPACLDRHVV